MVLALFLFSFTIGTKIMSTQFLAQIQTMFVLAAIESLGESITEAALSAYSLEQKLNTQTQSTTTNQQTMSTQSTSQSIRRNVSALIKDNVADVFAEYGITTLPNLDSLDAIVVFKSPYDAPGFFNIVSMQATKGIKKLFDRSERFSAPIQRSSDDFNTWLVAKGGSQRSGFPDLLKKGAHLDPSKCLVISSIPVDRIHGWEKATWAPSFQDLTLSHILPQLTDMSPEMMVEFLSKITKKAKMLDPYTLSIKVLAPRGYKEAIFCFKPEAAWVETSRRLDANHSFHYNNQVWSGYVMLGAFFLALTQGRKVSQQQVDGWVSNCATLWQRENNYGATLEDMDIQKVRNSNMLKAIKPISLNAKHSDAQARWPYLALGAAKFDASLMKDVKGLIFPDKYASEFLMLEDACNASMIWQLPLLEVLENYPNAEKQVAGWPLGNQALEAFKAYKDGKADKHMMEILNAYVVFKTHDGDKIAKALNRPQQAYGANYAAGTPSNPLMKANLHSWTGKGDAHFQGFPINVMLSNSMLGHGSGASMVRADWSLEYSVPKTMRGTLNWVQVPANIQAHLANIPNPLDKIVQALNKKVEAIIGKVFKDGDIMLTAFTGEDEIPLVSMTGLNQEVKVTGAKITRLSTSNSISIVIQTELIGKDSCLKLRGPGIKTITIPEQFSFSEELPVQIDMVMPCEAQKGRVAQVSLYAEAMKEVYGKAVIKDGVIYFERGNLMVNLGDPDSHFEKWVAENTKLYTMKRYLAPVFWKVFQMMNADIPCIKVIEETDSYVLVEETIQGLIGVLPVQVEVSTPRENTGRQSMLLEAISVLSVACPELATEMWSNKESETYRKSARQAIAMAEGITKDNIPTILLTETAKWKEIVFTPEGKKRNGKELMNYMSKQFPNGLVLQGTVDGNVDPYCSLYLIPDAIMAFGGFGTGGSAQGVSLEIISLIIALAQGSEAGDTNGFESAASQELYRVAGAVKAWAGTKGVMTSASVLKRLSKTAAFGTTGKVQTCHLPHMQSKGLLPVVVLHPDCAMVVEGGYKQGDVVLVQRVPMTSFLFCEVRISEKGAVAYAQLLPHVWAMSNEGDTDGDGIVLYSTFNKVDSTKAAELNRHLFGMGGYIHVYGEVKNWPCAEFFSLGDKWNKKLLSGLAVPQSVKDSSLKLGVVKPMLNYGLRSALVEDSESVQSHYSVNVGVAYGWCSILSHLSALNPQDNGILKACVVAWRTCYEGLGLGGYNPNTEAFFNAVGLAARGQMVTDLSTDKIKGCRLAGKGEIGITGVEFIVYHFDIEVETAKLLVEAEIIRSLYRDMEKKGYEAAVAKDEKLQANLINDAILFGALRRAGQGIGGHEVAEEWQVTNGVSAISQLEGVTGNAILDDVLLNVRWARAVVELNKEQESDD